MAFSMSKRELLQGGDGDQSEGKNIVNCENQIQKLSFDEITTNMQIDPYIIFFYIHDIS